MRVMRFANENFHIIDGVLVSAYPSALLDGELILPAGIAECSFAFCKLEGLQRAVLPKSLKKLSFNMFKGCKKLKEVVISEGTQCIEASAFEDCTALESITLPSTLLHIEEEAFMDCAALHNCILPQGLLYIDKDAFLGCTTLKEVALPASVQRVHSSLFYALPETPILTLHDNGDIIEADGLIYSQQTGALIHSRGVCEDLTIPPQIRSIAHRAFSFDKVTAKITIPKSVESLENYAFADSPALCEVIVDADLPSIPISCFENCHKLRCAHIRGAVKLIEMEAFDSCTALEDISLPQSLLALGTGTFFGCSALKTLELPEGITTVPEMFCHNCLSLEQVSFPSTLTTVLYGAFQNCLSFKEIKLPDSVTEVVSGAFNTEEYTVTPQDEVIKWNVHLSLSESYILLHKYNDGAFPIQLFIEFANIELGVVTVLRSSFSDCLLEVSGGDEQSIYKIAAEIVEDLGISNGVWTLTVTRPSQKDHAKDEDEDATSAESASSKEEIQPPARHKVICEQIDALIGVDEFKALANEWCEVVPKLRECLATETISESGLLFCVNEGGGFRSCIKHLNNLVDALKIFDGGLEAVEPILIGSTEDGLTKAYELVKNLYRTNRVVCLDLSEWVGDLKSINLQSFLKLVHKTVRQKLLVWRIPFVDLRIRRDVVAVLSNYQTIRIVALPPLTPEQTRLYASSLFSKYKHTVSDEAFDIFDRRIVEEKSDGIYFGYKTIRKVVHEMIYLKQSKGQPGKVISGDDVRKLLNDSTIREGDPMVMLDKMIGIGKIKERLLEIVAQIEYARVHSGEKRPILHMRFVGNPGTGKTTVARILSELLLRRGVLTKGKCYEYMGRDLCGRYIGETAPRTAGICRDAYGSVLFIDEAYTLYRGDNNDRDYGREALDTLVSEMENNCEKLLVIMAGYPAEMDTLMSANPGLSSRMPYVLDFPNYTREELCAIFFSMTGECDPEFTLSVKRYFDSLTDTVLHSKTFANARFVRNLFERTWAKASLRHQLDPTKQVVLTAADFDKASADREFAQLQTKHSRRIGF